MLSQNQILEKLSQQREQLLSIGVTKIGLFGSFARNEQNQDSDIDFLVEFNPLHETYDNLIRLNDLLSSLFEDRRIEIVTMNGLSPYIGPKILSEVSYAQIAA
ncbi:MAG: nucleotidyltransferase family protein [Bacteroidota bacterium]